MTEDYLSKLNTPQRDAVCWIDGPELVIAGAGSGKTRVLTYKIVHLLKQGYHPSSLMALTFTNKAAREMRERICALVGLETAGKLWMGTFHSIFARILRMNADRIGYTGDYTIYDTADSRSLIRMIIKDMGLDEKTYKPATVQSSISTAKNALISPERYAADRDLRDADRRARRDRMHEIYSAYVSRCRINNAMDFDDLLYYTNVLLRDNPDVLRHYQERFQYVLVDEYQDTNFAQHMIVSQLCAEHRRLCVVGDDAQSIYSFRGANIANILNLNRAYSDLRTFKLEQNYRSTQAITDAANALIAKNRMQIPKQVFSENAAGDPIEVMRCYSDLEEATLIASHINRQKMRSGDSYEDFAILYRTNAQSRVLEEALRRRNIPYRVYGGLAFYQRKEIKDAVAYLRMAVNPDDDEALKRIINTPARGIGDTTVGKLTAAAIANGVSIWQVINRPDLYPVAVNRGTRAKLDGFAQLIHGFNEAVEQKLDAPELVRRVITDTKLLVLLLSETTPENVAKSENLEELIRAAEEFANDRLEQEGDGADVSLPRFLTEVSLATDQDGKDNADGADERITLMTIHASKGLEFGNVFIAGVEDQLIPSMMSQDSAAGIEEERRLLYVAITRAKRYCMMSYAASRMINGQTTASRPSRFLTDIGRQHLRLMSGQDIPASSVSREQGMASYHSNVMGGRRDPGRWDAGVGPGAVQSGPRPVRPLSSGAPLAAAGQGTSPAADGAALHAAGELSSGMRIAHFKFGEGTVTQVKTDEPDHSIYVQFDSGDTRKLLLKYAKFRIL